MPTRQTAIAGMLALSSVSAIWSMSRPTGAPKPKPRPVAPAPLGERFNGPWIEFRDDEGYRLGTKDDQTVRCQWDNEIHCWRIVGIRMNGPTFDE